MLPDAEIAYRALQSRDARFDGWFFVAVTTTGIYCRPSCPATTPRREHVRFYPTAAAAQAAGFRACLRCRPDAVPGSPRWNQAADVAGRAMRLIADGVVDRDGVAGLARRLAYSPRHLRRVLVEQLGAGPLELARAQRAQTARLLIETTTVPLAEVAFAAGFSSVRQFNDTVRRVYALAPTEIRRRARRRRGAGAPAAPQAGRLTLRLPCRAPFDGDALLRFLGARAAPGLEELVGGVYRRTLSLPRGPAVVELAPRTGHVQCVLALTDIADLAAAIGRCRRLCDLDADPRAVDAVLARDPLLRPLVEAAPGRRVPGAVDGAEVAVRTVIGQQVSVAGARRLIGRVVAALGRPLAEPDGGLAVTFPGAAAIAAADSALLPLPDARRRALQALARAIAEGRVAVDAGADPDELRARLRELPGIGEWTVEIILMRLGDCDAFPATDLGVRRGLVTRGLPGDRVAALRRAEGWRPWRAYAAHHLCDPAAALPAADEGGAGPCGPAPRRSLVQR
jgi:AraC family transcriptional regulator of adaptative response / DNA-3-methyladenine glycosylase II